MADQFVTNQKLEFKEVVLSHLKRILELSCKELRDGTHIVQHPNMTQTIEAEDTRISYIQAIENLAYILTPYFDDQIKKVYEECIKIMNAFDFEIERDLKKQYEYVCKSIGRDSLGKEFFISMRIKYAKKLFYELNLLLKRIDYLKSAIYGEGETEEELE